MNARWSSQWSVTLVLLRSAVFVLFEANFDSDQAIVGLMAKHISEGRAFPLFGYAQNYNLAVEAWMAAPLFWLAGPSVTMLKLPLLAFNVAIVVLLIVSLEKELKLRPGLGGSRSRATRHRGAAIYNSRRIFFW